jgi:hypothetical protein
MIMFPPFSPLGTVARRAIAVKTWRPPWSLFFDEIDCCHAAAWFRNMPFTCLTAATQAEVCVLTDQLFFEVLCPTNPD